MDWARDRAIWPNAEASRFVACPPHRWHLQEAGTGPTLLLLHGAGGATQSWRHLLPALVRDFHVVAPDLPGQGFTRLGARMRCGIAPMAEDLRRLCEAEGWAPVAIVGHSAGAALALELARRMPVGHVVGINAALGKFEGVAGWLFPLMAKFMALNPLVPPLLARLAGGRDRALELLASTGSRIEPQGVALYQRLMSDKDHIDGTLAMMSQWDIGALLAALPDLDLPVTLLVGTADGTVPASVSERAARRLPNAQMVRFEGLGHLVHEEAADAVADAIRAALGAETARSQAAARAG